MAESGAHTTFALTGSAWASPIIDMQLSGPTRAVVDVTHLESTRTSSGYVVGEYIPGKYDPGNITITVLYDPEDPPPIDEDPQTATITFSDESTTYTCTASAAGDGAFCADSNVRMDEDRMVMDMVVELSGGLVLAT